MTASKLDSIASEYPKVTTATLAGILAPGSENIFTAWPHIKTVDDAIALIAALSVVGVLGFIFKHVGAGALNATGQFLAKKALENIVRRLSMLWVLLVIGALVILIIIFVSSNGRSECAEPRKVECTDETWDEVQKTGQLSSIRGFAAHCGGLLKSDIATEELNRLDGADYATARAADTIAAYNAYLTTWPGGHFAKEATASIELNNAKKAGTFEALQLYVKHNSYRVDEVYQLLRPLQEANEKAEFDAAKTRNTKAAYWAYLGKYRSNTADLGGIHVTEAQQRLKSLEDEEAKNEYNLVRAENTINAYRIYLNKHRDSAGAYIGTYVSEAQNELHNLEVSEEKVDFDAAKLKNTEEAYLLFLGKHQDASRNCSGSYVNEAQKALTSLQQDKEKSIYDAVKAINTIEAWQNYLDARRDSSGAYRGPFVIEAQNAIREIIKNKDEIQKAKDDAAWRKATTAGTAADFELYLKEFPQGRHAKEAKAKIKELEAGSPIRIFGNVGKVTSIAFSPDGLTALSGSDEALTLWDVTNGQAIRTFSGYTGVITSVAFSPKNHTALSGTSDGTIKLWDVETDQAIATFPGHKSGVTSISFSPDGRMILSGSSDNTLKLWDVGSATEVHTLSGHKSGVTCSVFSPKGDWALSGSSDGTLKLWEVATGDEIRSFTGHQTGVNSVAFSPDGRFALSGGADKAVRLWDISARLIRSSIPGNNAVKVVAFSPNGKVILTNDSTHLDLWNALTGQKKHSLDIPLPAQTKHHPKIALVTAAAFSPDGRFVLGGSDDKRLMLWDVSKWTLSQSTKDED